MFPVFADLVLLPAVIVGLVRVPLAPQCRKSQVVTGLGFSLFVLVGAFFQHMLCTLQYAANADFEFCLLCIEQTMWHAFGTNRAGIGLKPGGSPVHVEGGGKSG